MNLYAYVGRRLLLLVPTLLGVLTVTFFISHIVPGDAAQMIAGPRATAEIIARIRQEYGLDRPLHVQYGLYLSQVLRGDLGRSILTRRPVARDILDYFPATFELTTAALLIAVVVGIPLGMVSAVYRNRTVDHVSRAFSVVGVSMPIFWLGLLLMLVFYMKLGVLPGAGRVSGDPPDRVTGLYVLDSLLTGNWRAFADAALHLVMPACTLAFAVLARITRMTRSSMLEAFAQDYVRTARAKGLGERWVAVRHALRNALIPTLTVIGLSYGELLGGAVATELIFAWPGMTHYVVGSMTSLDFPAVMGVTLVISLVYILVNLVVDVSYALVDPRIRY
ncbi:MAG: ABC transporter permease [Candidatus Bipolaricaulaceae bacterium]